MLGGLLFMVCVILQFHYHDTIPWLVLSRDRRAEALVW